MLADVFLVEVITFSKGVADQFICLLYILLFLFVIFLSPIFEKYIPMKKRNSTKSFKGFSYSPRDCTLKGLILRKPLMVEEEKFVDETFMSFAVTWMASVQKKNCMVYGKGFS